MRSINWHKGLTLFLWIVPHLLLAVVAVICWKRRLYRDFPCFFTYIISEIAAFILLYGVYFVFNFSTTYAYVFSVTLLLSIVLHFGVIDEVSKDLFRESPFLKVSARRLLQCVGGSLLAMGVLLAVYAPGGNSARWQAGLNVVDRGAAMVQCGLLLSLLVLSRFLGVSWRRPAFGIALGFGIMSTVSLATSALRVEFSGNAIREFLNFLTSGIYFACVLIWIGYLLAPELEPVPPGIVSESEVETWNRELQHFLKH